MASWKGTFNDHQIASVLTYVRNNWGNKAVAVKDDHVKEIRAKEKARNRAWTVPELQKFPDR